MYAEGSRSRSDSGNESPEGSVVDNQLLLIDHDALDAARHVVMPACTEEVS